MKLIIVLILTLPYIFAYRNTDEFINEINSKQSSWRAGRNFYHGQPMSHIRAMPYDKSFLESALKQFPVVVHDENVEIPESFDARTNWPKCKNIGMVTDQGSCIACWAISVASVASDRVCIHSEGKLQPVFSAHQLVTCIPKSDYCHGCYGGFHYSAWVYWRDHGLVTGGYYNSTLQKTSSTPKCLETCSNSSINYQEDLIKGGQVYTVMAGNATQMQIEIMKNGPLTGWMALYEDFIYYKSGVYHVNTYLPIGIHTIRIIGWGVENGTDYWLVVNSWNEDWGDKGMMKVRRGTNECGIERGVVIGLPKTKF